MTPITDSAKEIAIDGVVHLKLPIRLQKLVDALEDAIDENTLFKNPDIGPNSGASLQLVNLDDN